MQWDDDSWKGFKADFEQLEKEDAEIEDVRYIRCSLFNVPPSSGKIRELCNHWISPRILDQQDGSRADLAVPEVPVVDEVECGSDLVDDPGAYLDTSWSRAQRCHYLGSTYRIQSE